MQKVYLLLRNNKQQGPFTIDELAGLELKHDDLIWVEGKSIGWSYPSEIEATRSFLPQSASNDPKPVTNFNSNQESISSSYPKKIFVSLPGNTQPRASANIDRPVEHNFERQADEIRKRAEAFMHTNYKEGSSALPETKYSRSLDQAEEEYTAWAIKTASQKKKKGVNKKVIVGLALVTIAVSSFFVLKPFNSDENGSSVDVERNATFTTRTTLSSTDDSLRANNSEVEALSTGQEVKSSKFPKSDYVNRIGKKTNISESFAATPLKQIDKHPASDSKREVTIVDEENVGQIKQPQEEISTSEPVVESQKKKTLKEKIGGFFEKIKSKSNKEAETAKDEERVPSSTSGSEPRSTRREEGAELNNVADLSASAHVSLSMPSGDWMMGVRGAKVVLRNTSNETIKKATVEVRYFNEQNEMLDKKIVQFLNIPSRKSITQAAPDHRTADHAEVFLITAVGDMSYAKQ